MNNKPSLSDVARVAGVTKPTVSIVLNGKGDKGRICRDTQNRIRAVARELGYQKLSTMPVPLPNPTTGVASKMAGLLLSASSPASSLALIPGLASRSSGAGCRLVVVTLPPDPAAARATILELIQEGFVSFICCPSVAPVVAAVSTVPVTKLEKEATGETVAELPIAELLRKAPVMETPIPPPVVAPKPAQATPETPPHVQPRQPPEVPQSAPTPAPISEQSPTPQPVAVVEPDPVSPPQEEPDVTPVVDPPMAAVEEEPPTAAEPPVETPSPEVLPEEPAPMPEVTPVEEPAVVTPAPAEPVVTLPPEPEPAPITPEPEPVSPTPVEPVVVEPEPVVPVVVEAEVEPLERGEPDAGNPSPQSSPARGEEAELTPPRSSTPCLRG